MTAPYYYHAPYYLSRTAVLDVGLKCVHSCKFCYYSYLDGSDDQFHGMRHAKFRDGADLHRVVDQFKASGFLNFDVTGGEPTLHPEIIELVRHASELGISQRIITLGQFLTKKHKHGKHETLLEDLLEAGVTNFLFSTHAVEEEMFQRLTGGSWLAQKAAMDALDEQGFQYTSNTTVMAGNVKHLPEIAREILRHNIYLHNFICMNAYHYWSNSGQALDVQATYTEMAHYLREAVAILEEGGVAVNIRYAPHCMLAGLEKNLVGVVGVRYDPYEWMNAVNHMSPTPTSDGLRLGLQAGTCDPSFTLVKASGQMAGVEVIAARSLPNSPEPSKVFPASCAQCTAMPVCDGLAPSYVKEHGDREVVCYVGPKRGDLLDNDRIAYKAPFFVKRSPDADMKSVVARALKPQPIGPKPKVSIIVTCYNYGHFLSQSLDCALGQTWDNLEVVLVDDGSTDNTPEIAADYAARYPDRLVYLRQENSGQPAIARNNGVAKSTGELILCLDADDLIEPPMVEECVGWLRKHPDASIVYSCAHNFGARDDIHVSQDYNFATLILKNHMPYCSLYKREVWENLGGYRTNVRGCEDWDFWIAAGGLGYFATMIPRVFFHYRNHGEGLYAQEVKPNFPEKFRQIVLNNADLYPPQMVHQARTGQPVTPMMG